LAFELLNKHSYPVTKFAVLLSTPLLSNSYFDLPLLGLAGIKEGNHRTPPSIHESVQIYSGKHRKFVL
jgi:hypothetical protein